MLITDVEEKIVYDKQYIYMSRDLQYKQFQIPLKNEKNTKYHE